MSKVARKKKCQTTPVLRVGVVLDLEVCCPGLHMLPATARSYGFSSGTYLQIECEAHSTVVIRKLVGCNRGCPGMRKGYVYVDPETAHFLCVRLHEEVTLTRSELELEVP